MLKDLIAIPERVHQGDFVLKLSEGVTNVRIKQPEGKTASERCSHATT